MKNTPSPCPSSRETFSGLCYLVFQMFLLPSLLNWVNAQLEVPLTGTEINFTFFFINFIAILLIFHDFLGRSAAQVLQHPIYFCQAVILGAAAYIACSWSVNFLIGLLVPGYTNLNDASLASMSQSSAFLMTIGTVILVPPVEECLFRGLIFRNLLGKNPWLAYLASMLAFALVHTLGYLGTYSLPGLLLAILQYLPAGLCLAWTYTKAGTVFAPILLHAAVNLYAISSLR